MNNTPEMGVESINSAKTFSDIDELASRCKFNDCQHEKEKIDNMYSSFDGIKNARNYIKSKSKRR